MKSSKWAQHGGNAPAPPPTGGDPFAKLHSTFKPISKPSMTSRPNAVPIKAPVNEQYQLHSAPRAPPSPSAMDFPLNKPMNRAESIPFAEPQSMKYPAQAAAHKENVSIYPSQPVESMTKSASIAEKASFITSRSAQDRVPDIPEEMAWLRASRPVADVPQATDGAEQSSFTNPRAMVLGPKAGESQSNIPVQDRLLHDPSLLKEKNERARAAQQDETANQLKKEEEAGRTDRFTRRSAESSLRNLSSSHEPDIAPHTRLQATAKSTEPFQATPTIIETAASIADGDSDDQLTALEAKERREFEERLAEKRKAMKAELEFKKRQREAEARAEEETRARATEAEVRKRIAEEEARVTAVAEELKKRHQEEEARIQAVEEASRRQEEEIARVQAAAATEKATEQEKKKRQAQITARQTAASSPTAFTPSSSTSAKAGKLSFIASRPILNPVAPSIKAERSRSPGPSTAYPGYSEISKQKEFTKQMMKDRAYNDKARELKHLQEPESVKTAWLSTSRERDVTGTHEDDLALGRRTTTESPWPATLSYEDDPVSSRKVDSYSSARDMLHARPDAVANGKRTVTPPNLIIPERRGSLTPPQVQPMIKKGQVERASNLTAAQETINSELLSPAVEMPPLDRKTSNEDSFLRSMKKPSKAPTSDGVKPIARLPHDKIAFTLRSSSLNDENHPAKVEVSHHTPLATAHAAMNKIDRDNVKTQGELGFKAWRKPDDRPPIFVRRVHLNGLPIGHTASQVLSLVWGGRIERLEYKTSSQQATVLFMTPEDCDKYYKATNNGIPIPGHGNRSATVTLANRAEAAHEFLRGLIAIGATRCIRVVGVDPSIGMGALTKLAQSGKRELERVINGTNPKNIRTVEFRFTNVYDAMRFKTELGKMEDWETCNILVAPDPCAKATAVHTGVGL